MPSYTLPLADGNRMWELPLEMDAADLINPSALHPAVPTRVLGALAIILSVCSLIRSLPGTGNVLVNCVAGFAGGIAALFVFHRDQIVPQKMGETLASHGVLRAVSAGSYSGLMALVSACSSACGMGGVALASLGTGLIVGICNTAIERAKDCKQGMSFVNTLRTNAGQGLFTQEGLLGSSISETLAESIVQYEAFFLSYAGLVSAFPWMGLTLAGTAVSGAVAGIASLAASAALRGVRRLSSCRDMWSSATSFRSTSRRLLDSCSGAAVHSSVIFVAYKAVYDGLMCAL